jgi:hypothetical protein
VRGRASFCKEVQSKKAAHDGLRALVRRSCDALQCAIQVVQGT